MFSTNNVVAVVKSKQSIPYLCFVKFIFPFLVWIYLFRHFLWGDITLSIDTNTNYAFLKFYLNNIRNGVFPLWDPFLFLGHPFISIVTAGVFNPLIYVITTLTCFGLSYYDAYLVYLVSYYFIGLFGFYILAREFLLDETVAYLAYLFLIFSGVGSSIFNQINMLLIFVPSVWFFCFLIKFGRHKKRSHFLGLIFCSMLILTSYMPFYFLTLLLVTITITVCLYRQTLINFCRCLFDFFKRNILTVIVSVLAIGVALLPILLFLFLNNTGEIVAPSRHCEFVDSKTCYEKTLTNDTTMSYAEASGGGLGYRVNFKNIFSHLNKANYAQDSLFYLPVLCYVLIFVSVFTIMTRKTVLITAIGVLIALIALVDATPVHRFLYEAIFYFRNFRNFFFLIVFLMPLLVLLASLQLKAMLEYSFKTHKERKDIIILVSLLHLLMIVLFINQGDILITSYITILGSWLVFVLYYGGFLKDKKRIVFIILGILVLIQPIQFFSIYSKNASVYHCPLPQRHVNLKFSFTREASDADVNCSIYKHFSIYKDYWYDMALSDAPSSFGLAWYLNRWVFQMFINNKDKKFLTDYAKNKIILYDNVKSHDDSENSLREVLKSINSFENLVFVAEIKEHPPRMNSGKPFVVTDDSGDLKILHFDVNSLIVTTNFAKEKFLVYIDSFSRFWKAFVNGREVKLYRAQWAFKGLWLPPGKNIVYLTYQPPGETKVYIFVLAFFFFFFIYVLYALLKERS